MIQSSLDNILDIRKIEESKSILNKYDDGSFYFTYSRLFSRVFNSQNDILIFGKMTPS